MVQENRYHSSSIIGLCSRTSMDIGFASSSQKKMHNNALPSTHALGHFTKLTVYYYTTSKIYGCYSELTLNVDRIL